MLPLSVGKANIQLANDTLRKHRKKMKNMSHAMFVEWNSTSTEKMKKKLWIYKQIRRLNMKQYYFSETFSSVSHSWTLCSEHLLHVMSFRSIYIFRFLSYSNCANHVKIHLFTFRECFVWNKQNKNDCICMFVYECDCNLHTLFISWSESKV